MQKKTWSNNSKEILDVINAVIDGKITVSLQGAKGGALRTKIVSVYYYRDIPYLLLAKPPGLTNSRSVRELLVKVRGLPILGFSCPITREADNLLATMLPQALYQLELRNAPRFTPLQGSMATFFIRGRSRVSICMLDNISMSGTKLTGTPTHNLVKNDIIGPCTLSLAGRDALINREVTVNKAIIVRVANGLAANQQEMGIKFELSEHEQLQLKEHMNFLMNGNRLQKV